MTEKLAIKLHIQIVLHFSLISIIPITFRTYLCIAGKFIKELSVTTKVKRVELQKDRDIYEKHAGYFGRHCQINGEFPNRLHAVYLLLRHVSVEFSVFS